MAVFSTSLFSTYNNSATVPTETFEGSMFMSSIKRALAKSEETRLIVSIN